MKRLAARAKLRFPDAEMGEMIYDGRKIDGVLICEAGTCQFVASAANGVIEGLTGADKSYLGVLHRQAGLQDAPRTRYVHLPDLQMERDELAATERSNAKILRKYAHYELLVVDEWLTEGVDDKDISLLFEPIEAPLRGGVDDAVHAVHASRMARAPGRRRAGRCHVR